MTGDKFQVFYSIEVRAAWIMRSNPSLGIVQEKYGSTLRRKRGWQDGRRIKHEGKRA